MPRKAVGLRDRIVSISTEYGLPLDPDRVVHDLSVGERQRIEIVRCLLQNPKLLIMDEPTSVLTPPEVQNAVRHPAPAGRRGLLDPLHQPQAGGSPRAVFRRHHHAAGPRTSAHCVPAEKTVKELAEIMINMDLHAPTPRPPSQAPRPPRLVLDQLTIRSPNHFGTDLKDISLSLAGGEILGIAGIAGNGQSELMDALSGEILAGRPESVLIDGMPAGHMGPADRRRIRGCFVPEERNGHGAVTTMSLAENAFLSGFLRDALVRFGVIDNRRTHAFADDIIKRFDVRTTGPKAQARSLSGGNLQKFLVGREVLQDPSVLIINQPTWGVDAGAALAIHEAIMALAQKGTAVMIISQDLDEIFVLADRIAVIAGGRISEPVRTRDATIELIGRLMGGTTAATPPAAIPGATLEQPVHA